MGGGSLKLGDKVACSQYVKNAGNHYEVIKAEDTPNNIEAAFYWEKGASESVEVDDFHSCQLFETVDKCFMGIFVGTTTLCTALECTYEEPTYSKDGFRFRKFNPQKFAIVYYANNRKRLVPLNSIKGAND